MSHSTAIIFLALIALLSGSTLPASDTISTKKQYFITITYQKDFPYKTYYSKNLIPGCKKAYKNRPVLRCDEYIMLMRPVALIKKWQDMQKKIGYLLITLPEFNIFNEAGKIVSIIPVATYSKHFLSETNSTGHMVTGKFIRHSDKVGHYMFTTEKDSVIDNINATDNHLFYVKNKNRFIPVSKIQPTDSLINKEGQTVHLMKRSVNSKNKNKKLMNDIPETVYNLEVSSNHTYFVGSHNILVHNTYISWMYYHYLVEENLIYTAKDSSYIYLQFTQENMIKFCSLPHDDGKYITECKTSVKLPKQIDSRLRRMGFISGDASGKSDKMILAVPMTRLEYEAILPYIDIQTSRSSASRSILETAIATYVKRTKETAREAYLEKRCSLYRSILAVLNNFYVARGLGLPEEESVLPGQQAYENYFHGLNNEELQSILDEKKQLWSDYQEARQCHSSGVFPVP